jgi:hypothetical protein
MSPQDKVAHHLPQLFSNSHYDMILEFMGKRPVFNPLHICDLMQDVDNIVGLTNEPIDLNVSGVK